MVAVLLTSVMIGNMLSMEHATLEPDGTLTVIVGPNGAGKSNVVRAVTLAGLGLEWLEERSSRLPGPETAQPARSAMAGYAASRCRTSVPSAPLRVEVGLSLGAENVGDMAVFLRAAIVSTLTASGDAHLGQSLSDWAERFITPPALADLASGTLVLQHTGSPDAPWDISWEFRFAGQRCRWGLSDVGGGRVSVLDADGGERPPGIANTYAPLSTVILGRPAGSKPSDVPEIPEFSLSLLLGKDGMPGEAPLVQASGGRLDPALGPHRAFAEMAELALWVQQPNRVYSLAWLLRRAFQRGLVFLGEQLRGIGTMAAPLRAAGRYSIDELASRAPGFEPHALPLRLMRLKNGSLEERVRFRRIQELFARLASGRGVELSFQVAGAGGDAEAEVAVTVLVTEQDSSSGSSWELPVQLCGAGTWEALVIAEALAGPDQVIVMDEPALNLHPGWQQQLLALLKERAGQSLLITHSPYLLPLEDEDDIYRIVRASRAGGVTRLSRARRPVPDPRAVIRDYSMSADARALLFASGAVLVEGDTELGALPRWFGKSESAARLGDPRQRHIAFYSVGGENHFKASLILLAALQIPWVIVCDGGPLRPDMGGNHIFRQIAGAAAASPALPKWIETFLDDPGKSIGLSFVDVKEEASRHRVFTLAPDWNRAKDEDGVTAESFEAFIRSEPDLAGQLALARDEVGSSKVRQGRWLADTHPCPPAVDRLYAQIVSAISSAAEEEAAGQGD